MGEEKTFLSKKQRAHNRRFCKLFVCIYYIYIYIDGDVSVKRRRNRWRKNKIKLWISLRLRGRRRDRQGAMGNGSSREGKESRRSRLKQKLQRFRTHRLHLRTRFSRNAAGVVNQRAVTVEDFSGIALLTLIGVYFLLLLLLLNYKFFISLRVVSLRCWRLCFWFIIFRRIWSLRTSGSLVFRSGNKHSGQRSQTRMSCLNFFLEDSYSLIITFFCLFLMNLQYGEANLELST